MVAASASSSVPNTNTKTTMSYTNAIMMSSGKGSNSSLMPASSSKGPNTVLTTTITATPVVTQTFAAKVSETATKDKEPIIKLPIAPPPPTSTSIFIRPPPTASAPPTLPATQSKPQQQQQPPQQPSLQQQSFSMQQAPASNLAALVNHPIPPLSAQLSQQLSHPPPPLPASITSGNQAGKMADLQVPNVNAEEHSPVSAASEYSLFNDTFSKVTQQTMWGRECEESNSQKGMNFASVVTATGSPSTSVGNSNAHAKYLDSEPPMQVRQ